MKKVIITLTLLAFASTAFAAAPSSSLQGFKASKNVTTDYQNGGSPADRWAGASGHSAGDKNYATTSAFGGMAQKTVTPGATVAAPAAPGSSTDSAVPSTYSSM
jgi:hypothetical protein